MSNPPESYYRPSNVVVGDIGREGAITRRNVLLIEDGSGLAPFPDPIRESDFNTRPSRLQSAWTLRPNAWGEDYSRDDFTAEAGHSLTANYAATPVGVHNIWEDDPRRNYGRLIPDELGDVIGEGQVQPGERILW